MKCPFCNKGKIETKKEYDDNEEKYYLIETCTKCDYYDKIYLHGVKHERAR